MAKKTDKRQYHNSPPTKGEDMELAPKSAMRREFGKRLQANMIEKGWNQSELARRASIGRDNVSSYIRGIAMPGPLHLSAISRALGMTNDSLLPAKSMPSIDETFPVMDIKDVGNGNAWLRVNQAVSMKNAIKIMQILTVKNNDED
tara:strand:- start:1845 stop:2282 length:438 start_codon:yes stop_codon:yes gene_type:complete